MLLAGLEALSLDYKKVLIFISLKEIFPFMICSIRCKHNVRWQHLSRYHLILIDETYFEL